MKIQYVAKNFNAEKLELIKHARRIIARFKSLDIKLTLRQLYYQFIGQNLLPESWVDEEYNRRRSLPPDTKNTDKNYKRLGVLIADARLGGQISWHDIEDRLRSVSSPAHWTTPRNRLYSAAYYFRIDKWIDQDFRVELWAEKDAMASVLEPICFKLDIPFFACRGYTSMSAMWEGAQRMREYAKEGKTPFIIHFGDHDPSGCDMSNDIQKRMDMFGAGISFDRIALNMNQVEHYALPPDPAKVTDSRAKGYIARYGDRSWELDALDPLVLRQLATKAVREVRDDDKWRAKCEEERELRLDMFKVYNNWSEVVELMAGIGEDDPYYQDEYDYFDDDGEFQEEDTSDVDEIEEEDDSSASDDYDDEEE